MLNNDELRALSLQEVQRKTSLSRDSIDRLEAQDRFPKRIALSDKRVAWLSSEIDAWILERAATRATTLNAD